jgi:hypothetical protein
MRRNSTIEQHANSRLPLQEQGHALYESSKLPGIVHFRSKRFKALFSLASPDVS